ncbi:hypothetical protein DDB_G0281655 [Dictyostelium discoideum AX4]|uniref:Uncharacterized protein n=1 Tax=Dictyostelium discoideum TaxID=44689 RepID=Q54TN0_DICDI|nr:hypothetical protein DDB_G0281655 [Dictyostelium discoideum AX4]EAL66589.1 hypothetical protein DDB_G0281655 [Dictyostelium discoideum AX4]|eukprot:XP_640561.1 hypothetical protein DDB_G0281655 [Dictyostelium discoideum AX4]
MNLNKKNEIDYQIKELTFQLEEIKKTKGCIYQKKCGIYFLQTSKDQITSNLKDDISNKNKELEGFKEFTTKNNTTKNNTTNNSKFKPNVPNKQKK